MHSNKKISKIVLVLSLVAVFSFLTILSINGLSFQSEQYQIDNDASSIIQAKEDGGGGIPTVIILAKEDGGGGIPTVIILAKEDGGGGIPTVIILAKDDGGGGIPTQMVL